MLLVSTQAGMQDLAGQKPEKGEKPMRATKLTLGFSGPKILVCKTYLFVPFMFCSVALLFCTPSGPD
jgi:hypothetical protein